MLMKIVFLLFLLLNKLLTKLGKIIVTNDSGRLSKEAKEFEEQDKITKEKIYAKNSLKNYIYSMKNM